MKDIFAKGWDSYDKNKFEVGEIYWVIYMETTNKGDSIRHRNGVSQYKCLSNKIKYVELEARYQTPDRMGYWSGNTTFEHISGKQIHNDYAYLDGYGTARCYFFNDLQDAKDAHDNWIIDLAKGQTVSSKNAMYKHLFGPSPLAPKEEVEAMNFYNSLSKEDKKHVKWLKEYGNIH